MGAVRTHTDAFRKGTTFVDTAAVAQEDLG
jgi:hypothetical protein